MNKSKLRVLLVCMSIVGLIILLVCIPVATKSTGCATSKRYSIILGQLDEYNSKQQYTSGILKGYCGDGGMFRLFIL